MFFMLLLDAESVTSEKSKHTKRYYKFVELWQTETNYVGILRTIMTVSCFPIYLHCDLFYTK